MAFGTCLSACCDGSGVPLEDCGVCSQIPIVLYYTFYHISGPTTGCNADCNDFFSTLVGTYELNKVGASYASDCIVIPGGTPCAFASGLRIGFSCSDIVPRWNFYSNSSCTSFSYLKSPDTNVSFSCEPLLYEGEYQVNCGGGLFSHWGVTLSE